MLKLFENRAFVVEKIWGSRRFNTIKNNEDCLVGEFWEVSTLPEGESLIDGKGLKNILGRELSYLIKLLTTTDNLSFQVHPKDVGEQKGKSECWFVLNSEPNAGVYLGLKPGLTREIFTKKVNAGENLAECFNFIPLKKGDFLYAPAGTFHSIGKGIDLIEIQQACGTTYRVWDWNRKDDKGNLRDLHIEKALSVGNFSQEENDGSHFMQQNDLLKKRGKFPLIEHPDFKVTFIGLNEGEEITLFTEKGVSSLLVIEGNIEYQDSQLKPLTGYTCSEGPGRIVIKSKSTTAGLLWVTE